MKNQCVAVENNGKKAYAKPCIEVVDLNAENIICGSGDTVNAILSGDPWSGNTEQTW